MNSQKRRKIWWMKNRRQPYSSILSNERRRMTHIQLQLSLAKLSFEWYTVVCGRNWSHEEREIEAKEDPTKRMKKCVRTNWIPIQSLGVLVGVGEIRWRRIRSLCNWNSQQWTSRERRGIEERTKTVRRRSDHPRPVLEHMSGATTTRKYFEGWWLRHQSTACPEGIRLYIYSRHFDQSTRLHLEEDCWRTLQNRKEFGLRWLGRKRFHNTPSVCCIQNPDKQGCCRNHRVLPNHKECCQQHLLPTDHHQQ